MHSPPAPHPHPPPPLRVQLVCLMYHAKNSARCGVVLAFGEQQILWKTCLWSYTCILGSNSRRAFSPENEQGPKRKDKEKVKVKAKEWDKKEQKRVKELNRIVPFVGASKQDCNDFFAKSMPLVLLWSVDHTTNSVRILWISVSQWCQQEQHSMGECIMQFCGSILTHCPSQNVLVTNTLILVCISFRMLEE